MKRLLRFTLVSAALLWFGTNANALVLLDDKFLLGNRTNQTLPTSSQWFVNSATTLTNEVGNMTGVIPTSSCMWMTYFMPPGNPSALAIGDTIKLTMTFSNIGVSLGGSVTINGPRIGLFNYSAGGVRISADGFSTGAGNGANVLGYCLFMNFGQTNGVANPMSLRKRTGTGDGALMSAGGDYTEVANGGGALGDPAFSNNVPYTMVFSVTRSGADSAVISNSFTGPGLNKLVVSTDSSGAVTNFDCFAMRPPSSQASTTNIVITELKVEGPAGLLTPATITGDPKDMTLTVSDFGIFNAAAAGALPLKYQWYFNNTATPLANETNLNLTLLNIQTSQAGQYFMVASNAQGSATSGVATLTVTTPTHTPRGLILDDKFQNASRLVSVTPTNSDWASSVDSVLGQPVIPGSLVGLSQTNTSTLWVGNFVDPIASDPVDLNVGDALRVTLTFTPTNPAPLNTGSLRFGIFDFYDGSRILSQDGNLDLPSWNGGGGGTNARGYMLTVNFGTAFGDGTPLALFVRNNLPSTSLMGSSGDFASMGSGPSGMSNAPAFLSGSNYVLQITAARMATTSMQVSARITGPQLSNLGFLATDNTYFTHRFSGFAIRPNRTSDSADVLNITEFKVEVIAATNTTQIAPFQITAAGNTTSTNFYLTWNSVPGTFYQVQSTTNLSPVFWVTNTTLAASGTSATWTNLNTAGTNIYHPVEGIRPAEFYRVVAPVQP